MSLPVGIRPSTRHSEDGDKYNPTVGAIYIFNLIVGTGALTIPAAFGQAGWILGLVLITLLCFISYVTATFVVESMSTTNALLRWQSMQKSLPSHKEIVNELHGTDSRKLIKSRKLRKFVEIDMRLNAEIETNDDSPNDISSEEAHLLDSNDVNVNVTIAPVNLFAINTQVEMGQMAGMFFNKVGLISFYIVICIYLYGDLTIYAAAVSKTLRDIACFAGVNYTDGNDSITISDDAFCLPITSVTRLEAYRIFLLFFALTLVPFVFFNVQKTKFLQLTTSLLRWIAFGIMVAFASIHLASSQNRAAPRTFNYGGLPNLFGVCVYSFMCHHSLPSLVTPIKPKIHLYSVIAFDYGLVLAFYVLLALTGVFSFETLRDLYTLNFEPNSSGTSQDITADNVGIQYFLALFPVFTLGANFPIIAITLRNNLRELGASLGLPTNVGQFSVYVCAILATIPPILVALITANIQVLVSVTGSFAGVGVQYVIPTALLMLSRRACKRTIGLPIKNNHASPFKHWVWTTFILVWTVMCVAFILVNYTLIIL